MRWMPLVDAASRTQYAIRRRRVSSLPSGRESHPHIAAGIDHIYSLPDHAAHVLVRGIQSAIYRAVVGDKSLTYNMDGAK